MRLPTFSEWLQRKLNEIGAPPAAPTTSGAPPTDPSAVQALAQMKPALKQQAMQDPTAGIGDIAKKAALSALPNVANPLAAAKALDPEGDQAASPMAPKPAYMNKGMGKQ